MTAVLLLGDIPSTNLIRGVMADRVVTESWSTPQTTDVFTERVSVALEAGKSALLIYPAWQADVARRMLPLLRGIFATDRVGGVGLHLPPLALSLVADQLAYLASYVQPGVLATMAHRLAESIIAGAWVSSVARLEHLETGIGKHVASYLPGSGFLATTTPTAMVHRITGTQPVPAFAHQPLDPVIMLASHQDGDLAWLSRELQPAVGAVSLTSLPPQPLSRRFWGTKNYIEFVALSGNPKALERLVRATPFRACSWCGELTALETCAFCSMVQPPYTAQPAQPPTVGLRLPAGAAGRQPPRARPAPSPKAPGTARRSSSAPAARPRRSAARPAVSEPARPAPVASPDGRSQRVWPPVHTSSPSAQQSPPQSPPRSPPGGQPRSSMSEASGSWSAAPAKGPPVTSRSPQGPREQTATEVDEPPPTFVTTGRLSGGPAQRSPSPPDRAPGTK